MNSLEQSATLARRSPASGGYLPGVEIYEGYARLHPHNCAVKERTGDGVPAGPCCYYLKNGTTCLRHGKVKADNDAAVARQSPQAAGSASNASVTHPSAV